MHYDKFFMLSCLLGDELYRSAQPETHRPDLDDLEKRFQRLYGQPIGEFITSGLPRFMMNKKLLFNAR